MRNKATSRSHAKLPLHDVTDKAPLKALGLAWKVLTAGFRFPTANRRHVRPVVLTIGYERHQTPESLVSLLTEAGVERLVDVRDLPMSRRRGFSKTALAQALEAAGVAYEHTRPLGNPKPYRDLYRSGQQEEGERLFLAHLRNGSGPAVDALSATLQDWRTCLLCFEHDHRDCHRALIVEELRERCPDLCVEHL